MALHNFESTKVPLDMKWNLDKLQVLLNDYPNNVIIEFMRYGWPISHDNTTGSSWVPNNWPGVLHNEKAVIDYFAMELSNGSVLGPVNGNPFCSKALLSPLSTRDKKDSVKKHVTVDMSFPQGNSVDDGIKKDSYLDNQILLKYPMVD